MPFWDPCYLAHCDLIAERVWIYVKCLHCAITQRTKRKKKLFHFLYGVFMLMFVRKLSFFFSLAHCDLIAERVWIYVNVYNAL